MALEILNTAPDATAFTPLEEHQTQTPGTFFGGKAVLHLHSANAQLLVSKSELEAQSAFPDFRVASSINGTAVNGESEASAGADQILIPGIDIWVTSERLILFSSAKSTGVSIPYPTISLHATQRLTLPAGGAEVQGLYMQLLTNDNEYSNEDDDFETLELTIVPSSDSTTTASSGTTSEPATSDIPSTFTPIQALFAAVSACADLNPDPNPSDDEEDPSTMPGTGGWITAENIGDFTDENGNFAGGFGSLGAGAGTVRAREDGEEEQFEDVEDGEAAAGEETKWRRTE